MVIGFKRDVCLYLCTCIFISDFDEDDDGSDEHIDRKYNFFK